MTEPREKLCIALDGSDLGWIVDMAQQVAPVSGWLKLGLEAFTAHGPTLVEAVAATGARVFLDLKLHDIPNTVQRAAANCAALGVGMFNVHASGGRAMLEAAVRGTREGTPPGGSPPKVVAVTVLTSLDRPALAELGIGTDPTDLAVRWALLARDSGLDGVVASAREAPAIREACGRDFVIVTPGIRPSWAAADDQRRIVTPAEAAAGGADILVVGRPVTRSRNPAAAARAIIAELDPAADRRPAAP